MPIEFLLNGKQVRASGFPTHTTLLDYVRAQGLTGSKEGCAEGECGACTMVAVRSHLPGSAYIPFNSCLILLPMAAGQEVYTVEALESNGQLHEVQQAMITHGGSQCGYCTPGFVVSMFAEQYRRDRIGAYDPHNLGGNLCRCTGYRPIRDALASLGEPTGRFLDRLASPAPSMSGFECEGFSRPNTLTECLRYLNPDSHCIAGGTDLGVEINLKGKRFPHLVSLEALPELRVFEETADRVVIGAGLSLSEIPWQYQPFQEWLKLFASPLIRNRATLGGNLATASPIGDAAPFLLALDASLQLSGRHAHRTVPLSNFFQSYRKTLLEPGELIVAIEIPKPLPDRLRFYKVAKRRMDDISTVAAAFSIGDRGTRMAFGGVAATPVRCLEAEQAASVSEAKAVIAKILKPIGDHRGSAEYRLAMAQSLLDKFWYEA